MTLKQISYHFIFFQRRFNVSLLFFNVVSTLKQRRCACWVASTAVVDICSAVLQTAAVVLPTAAVVLPKTAVVLSSASDVLQ